VSTTAAPAVAAPATASRGPLRQAVRRFRRRRIGVSALAIVIVFFIVGFFAKQLAPYAPEDEFLNYLGHPQPPLTAHHLLGTDAISHDFLSQLLVAIHETTISSLTCAGLATVAGTVVGALAGFYGGWFDALVSWVTTVVVAVPAVAFLLVVIIWNRAPVTPMEYAYWLTAVLWIPVARVVRATVLTLRTREYIEAAHALGAVGPRIIARHIIPNAGGTILVAATTVVSQSIVLVATVDYLGYGFNQYDKPTLGGLLAVATHGILAPGSFTPAPAPWWLFVFPAVLLVLLLVSVNFAGDALDDALNPRTSSPG
jgi:peptide/nickel transport system permease protein